MKGRRGSGKGRENRREEDKNDPSNGLHLGLGIDVLLSTGSVISPTNHNVTSTGQYHTLRASSTHVGLPLSACTAQHSRVTASV